MHPRTFIHFARNGAALVLDLSTLCGPPACTSSLVCYARTSWQETLGPWLAARGIDLQDLLPGPTATNTPGAPSWASVPDELLHEFASDSASFIGAQIGLPVRVTSVRGEYWLHGDEVSARVPGCLLADLELAPFHQAA